MADLLGIIAPLKKFLSNSEENITIPIDGDRKTILKLEANRIYKIPDFQREIRWSNTNVAALVEDIKTGSAFFGNIILTKCSPKEFSIIDGQQRITILTMILKCIKHLHEDDIEVLTPCKLEIESFKGFWQLSEQAFCESAITSEVLKSDKLKQIKKYIDLWNYIVEMDDIKNKATAKTILNNMANGSFNVIINEADEETQSIRYFIDVNLKGQKLDVEDIFKGYLFRNDSSQEIREQWYALKMIAAEIETSRFEYPILKLLEHYLLCDLYKNDNYRGIDFGTDFVLRKEYENEDGNTYAKGTHVIEAINSNRYMKKSIEQLNRISSVMLEIVNNDSLSKGFVDLFPKKASGSSVFDDNELKIFHNIIKKMLKDSNVLPKALIVKYFLSVLYGEAPKKKGDFQTIYGVYLFFVFFSVFENKKSTEVLITILKAKNACWYDELIRQLKTYFALDKISDAKILSRYKLGLNEDEEDQRFRCKLLATVYNYFAIQNNIVKVKKGEKKKLLEFITNDGKYSIEHFVISEGKGANSKKMSVNGQEYSLDPPIYNKYVNNYFNFIFIDSELNSDLGNKCLPEKMEHIIDAEIDCEYSQMIIDNLRELANAFPNTDGDKWEKDLDYFFYKDFKELYLKYAKNVLEAVINRIAKN